MFSKFQFNIKVPEGNANADKPSMIDSYQELLGKSNKILAKEKHFLLEGLCSRKEPVVWVCLEEEDRDPGRFWLKFITAVRKYIPNAGEELLTGLVNHHSQPLFSSVKKLLNDLQGNDILTVLENINLVQATSWWHSTLDLITNQNLAFQWFGIEYGQSGIIDNQNLNSQFLSIMVTWDVFWNDWLKSKNVFQITNKINKLEQLGLISFKTEEFSIPVQGWLELIDGKKDTFDSVEQSTLLSYLAHWFFSNEEWLEGIRVLILLKEFEQAGEILEKYGAGWLEEGFEPLELLFWLREIPGVLLESSPVICWLAAKACKATNLTFLMSYYINHAENTLTSLTRISRNHDQWLQIEINEDGLKIGDLMEKLKQLKN